MTAECYPVSILPHSSRLFLDYAERHEPLAPFYGTTPYGNAWMRAGQAGTLQRDALADLLIEQNRGFGAQSATLENIERLRQGARAVVTGQQVSLLGGPLFTLLKAATAVRKAADATQAGMPHVPIFWLATEDHDLAEAEQVTLPSRRELHTLKIETAHKANVPVGKVRLGEDVRRVLAEADSLLGPGATMELLENCYRPDATFAEAFGKLMAALFAGHGLIVLDAASREFHALGAEVLRRAIVDAAELQEALVGRDKELAEAGYHSQVLVQPQGSLLFLIDAESGARVPLKRSEGHWLAARKQYSTEELLRILEAEPERISPNALLRPVFQDAILPTSAYIGGPAETAYFAQSNVLYERLLGGTTPVIPRLSATLIEPPVAKLLAQHELTVATIFSEHGQEMVQRLGARAIPLEGKHKISAAGNAFDQELTALTEWMHSLDAGLGRSADVSASKMRHQMNRLRRLAANFELERNASLKRQAETIELNLFPRQHPQERVVGAAWFHARYGDGLIDLLVEHAAQECPGHRAIFL